MPGPITGVALPLLDTSSLLNTMGESVRIMTAIDQKQASNVVFIDIAKFLLGKVITRKKKQVAKATAEKRSSRAKSRVLLLSVEK
jgi:hypothetical protein